MLHRAPRLPGGHAELQEPLQERVANPVPRELPHDLTQLTVSNQCRTYHQPLGFSVYRQVWRPVLRQLRDPLEDHLPIGSLVSDNSGDFAKQIRVARLPQLIPNSVKHSSTSSQFSFLP